MRQLLCSPSGDKGIDVGMPVHPLYVIKCKQGDKWGQKQEGGPSKMVSEVFTENMNHHRDQTLSYRKTKSVLMCRVLLSDLAGSYQSKNPFL